MEFVVAVGNGEWEDTGKLRCRIYFKSPAEWADAMYQYAERASTFGSVLTVFELREGSTTSDAPFHGLDAGTVLAAVRVLRDTGRADMFESGVGADTDLVGVKLKRMLA